MAHTDVLRRMVATEYNLDYSTYAQHVQEYPATFNYMNYGYSSQSATVDGFHAFCGNGVQQSLYLPPTYTDPRCAAQVNRARCQSAQSSISPIVKAEDINQGVADFAPHSISPQELHSPVSS